MPSGYRNLFKQTDQYMQATPVVHDLEIDGQPSIQQQRDVLRQEALEGYRGARNAAEAEGYFNLINEYDKRKSRDDLYDAEERRKRHKLANEIEGKALEERLKMMRGKDVK